MNTIQNYRMQNNRANKLNSGKQPYGKLQMAPQLYFNTELKNRSAMGHKRSLICHPVELVPLQNWKEEQNILVKDES